MEETTSKEEFTGIEWPDYLVIAAYFIFVLIVGLIVSIILSYFGDFLKYLI